MSMSIEQVIHFCCRRTRVDPEFVIEMMHRESGRDKYAVGDLEYPGGAYGYYQYHKPTYEWAHKKYLGTDVDWSAEEDPRFNRWEATRVTVALLRDGFVYLWTAGRQLLEEGWSEFLPE